MARTPHFFFGRLRLLIFFFWMALPPPPPINLQSPLLNLIKDVPHSSCPLGRSQSIPRSYPGTPFASSLLFLFSMGQAVPYEVLCSYFSPFSPFHSLDVVDGPGVDLALTIGVPLSPRVFSCIFRDHLSRCRRVEFPCFSLVPLSFQCLVLFFRMALSPLVVCLFRASPRRPYTAPLFFHPFLLDDAFVFCRNPPLLILKSSLGVYMLLIFLWMHVLLSWSSSPL